METKDAEFHKLYNMLNHMQKNAVDAIEGPVMVIAGPGTGKTQILTLRIANILKKTDIPADAILALTFTNAAAANMRKRLVSIIGSDAYRVSIFTFHSFANHLIEQYLERFSILIGKSNCSEVEHIDIIRNLIDTGAFELLKPIGEPYYHVPKIISAISHLKREGITPTTFRTWIDHERQSIHATDDLYHTKGAHKGKIKGDYQKKLRELDKNTELALMYERYQQELASRKRFDFDDSLISLIEAMETHEDFLRELQEEYQYFLVDEHQDTNGAQNKILELLLSFFDSPNIFVVGDEKQAIFRFQGASLANFLYFEKKFTNVTRITLATNYRSHQGVLDAAGALIEKSREGIHAPLTSHNHEKNTLNTRLKIYTFSADDEELLFLAESVKHLIESGVQAHEIAVLYRNNRDVDDIADYFERLSIPFLIASGHGVLDDPDIRKFNLILRALVNLDNDEVMIKTLFISFLHIPIPDIYSIAKEARQKKQTIFETLTQAGSLTLSEKNAVLDFVKKIQLWKKIAENNTFLTLFETVVRESGLLQHIQQSSFHTEKFDKLVRLFDEMKAHVRKNPFFSLTEYETFLRILEDHNITLEARSRHVPNSVHLMTAHKAKGLEFDHVFIVHAYDGHWGGKRTHEYFKLPFRNGEQFLAGDNTEDERRLFYVALTRARKEIYISYSAIAPDGRDRVPTQFLEEIYPHLKDEKTGDMLGYAGKRPPLFVERIGRHGKEKYVEFVKATFLERGLSVTAINNYLSCPWKWFYQNFFYTQFVLTAHQVKGTAVHKALEEYFNERNKNPETDLSFLLNRFSTHLEDSDIEPLLLERLVRDTQKALSGWYTMWNQQWENKTKNEIRINGVLLDQKVLLNGTIDKFECLDEQCHLVRVIDYKTGKPKSRNEIEGSTQTLKHTKGSGQYKRQLVFYTLLLENFANGMYTMTEGVLDFIEPTESGLYKREKFVITSEEKNELRETIYRIAEEISTLSFWDTRCDDPQCSFCELRNLMDENDLTH